MDFDDTPEEAAVRADALAWLDANAKLSDPSQIDEMRTHRAHTEEDDEALHRRSPRLAAAQGRCRLGGAAVAVGLRGS